VIRMFEDDFGLETLILRENPSQPRSWVE
jgi:hypothetical protein